MNAGLLVELFFFTSFCFLITKISASHPKEQFEKLFCPVVVWPVFKFMEIYGIKSVYFQLSTFSNNLIIG